MAACRSCGAPVVWVLTEGGNRMPVDPDPVEGGNIVLTRENESDGTPLAAYAKADPGVMRHVSHFATCPSAAQHRER